MVSAEQLRLDEADMGGVPWRRWGPHLSERQWGTVREDCGSGNNTWSYFPHEQARSRAYRWGEDGLAVVDVAFAKRQLGLLRARHPDTVMVAEACWGKEWELQRQGFRFCYGKRLYDRILAPGEFERDGTELAGPGLFAGLGPWQFHLLAVK